jgi:hypothetical protein
LGECRNVELSTVDLLANLDCDQVTTNYYECLRVYVLWIGTNLLNQEFHITAKFIKETTFDPRQRKLQYHALQYFRNITPVISTSSIKYFNKTSLTMCSR